MSVPGPAGLVGLDQLEFVEPRNRGMIERGASLTLVEHAQWVEQCRAASLEFLELWDDIDILVTPTCGMVPPSVDWAPWDQTAEEHMATFATFPNFAQPFNLTGQPRDQPPARLERRRPPDRRPTRRATLRRDNAAPGVGAARRRHAMGRTTPDARVTT